MATLIIIRHGEAVAGPVDRERALSPPGREQVTRLAEELLRRDVEIDEIRHSGLVRARETAEIVAAGVRGAPRIVEGAGIDSSDDPEIFAAGLEAWPGTLAIVSHMPFVRRLSALLTDGDPDGTGLAFPAASAACLEPASDGRWSVAWVEGASRTPPDARS